MYPKVAFRVHIILDMYPKWHFWGTCLVFISIKISSIFGFLLIVQAALAQLGIEDMLRQIVSYTLSYGQSISIWLVNEVNSNIFGICPVFGWPICAVFGCTITISSFWDNNLIFLISTKLQKNPLITKQIERKIIYKTATSQLVRDGSVFFIWFALALFVLVCRGFCYFIVGTHGSCVRSHENVTYYIWNS